ncbi:MAG: histidine kinase [Saprospiraceae bacterium]|nr:histidine kinase [Saprospiraceae bacterium]
MNFLEGINKSDWWVIIGFWIMALPIVVSDYISHMSLPKAIKLSVVDVLIITAVSIVVVYFLAPRYLSKRKYLRFFTWMFVLLLAEAMAYFFGYGLIWSWRIPESWLEFIGDEIVSGGQSMGILGGILLAKKYFEGQQDILKLKAETKSNELRALQSQIDPHFLFNNLNSLDELIDVNPNEAKRYVNKLALLYRHLINSKDKDVVTLEEEMAFAENYIYLLKQRYGDSFVFKVDKTSQSGKTHLVPPASLQLILENVVKHNIGSIENPLITQIQLSDSQIICTNQKRLKKKHMNLGTGLENLKTRYNLLYDQNVIIYEDEEMYRISLPLIPLIE